MSTGGAEIQRTVLSFMEDFPLARVSDADFITGPIQGSALKKVFFPKSSRVTKNRKELLCDGAV